MSLLRKREEKGDPLEEQMGSLWRLLAEEYKLGEKSIHGPTHWARVEAYGMYLARETGADLIVVRLFAIFHDCQRRAEGNDPDHGPRAAERARELRELLPIDDEALETLCQACSGHTHLRFSHDPTIAACWDSDRLDLDRVGMIPSADYMSTEPGKRLCDMDAETRRRLVGVSR